MRHDIEVVRDITAEFTQHDYVWAETKRDQEQLWGARKHAFWAAMQMGGEKRQLMATDVAVPISRLADCIQVRL